MKSGKCPSKICICFKRCYLKCIKKIKLSLSKKIEFSTSAIKE